MAGTTIKSVWTLASLTLRGYCICGGAIHLTVKDPDVVQVVMGTFAAAHQGEGHGPCDSKTAAKARRKLEREERRFQ